MSIYLGSNKINELYLGSQKIGSIYLSSQKVYQSGPSFDYVTIGSMIWTSKNLSIDDGLGGIITQTVNYGQGDVVEYYYTWDAAVRVANSIPGWHLPSTTEWDSLSSTVGSNPGTKLKSTYGWSSGNGTDNFGFTAFPTGGWTNGSLSGLKTNTYFWTPNQYSSSNSYRYRLSTGIGLYSGNASKTYGYSVRLVKDA